MDRAPLQDAQVAATALDPRRRSLAFATLTIAFVMDVLDSTIVNIAVPAIRADLAAGPSAVQWMVAGYSTAFAMLLISGGRLGDIFGYRRMFLIGVGGFTLASLLCGLARDPAELIAARLVQGATAACMGPQVLALVQLLYPPFERVRVLSFFGLLGGLSAVLGPIVGGALIDLDPLGLGWRLIFLINLPVGIAGLIAGARLLPGGRSAHPLRIDVAGNLLMIALLFALILPLVEGRALGWPWWCIALLAAVVPLALVLVRHLRRRTARDGSALIEPTLFADRRFANGLLTSLVFATAGGGFFLVLTLALQVGLGLDPLAAGLIHVPFAFGVGFGVSVIGRRLLPRLGRHVVTGGAGLMALGLALLIPLLAGGRADYLLIGGALLLAGLGMGMVAGPLTPIALARVDTRHAGGAGGLLKSVQQLGTALGAALIGALFFAAGGGGAPAAVRHAFTAAALAMILLLAVVALLALRFPRLLFAPPAE